VDKDLIRSFLWEDVMNLGFYPGDLKSKKKWLRALLSSLREFWDISEHQEGPCGKEGTITGRIDNSHFNIWLKFELRENGYLHVELGHIDGRVLFYHSDPDYFVPQLSKILDNKQRNIAIGESETTDIELVLASCMFHPREHLHIVAPDFDHQARIGGGISNPFLYLFHLRYQLCPIPQKREAEKGRLLELFRNAIYSNSRINAEDLMAQP